MPGRLYQVFVHRKEDIILLLFLIIVILYKYMIVWGLNMYVGCAVITMLKIMIYCILALLLFVRQSLPCKYGSI